MEQAIKLDMVLSTATLGPSAKLNVVGFGEGTNIIFGSANGGIFVVWRNSGWVMKIGGKWVSCHVKMSHPHVFLPELLHSK
jgi:hypothetical protein